MDARLRIGFVDLYCSIALTFLDLEDTVQRRISHSTLSIY